MRMSGGPSCASIEPSIYSTIEWITDCGWTMISIRVAVDREQPRRLDQLEPLVHHRRRIDRDLGAHRPVGMRHRLLGRDVAHLGSSVQSRNGPPLAVRMIRRTRSGRAGSKHWKIALCSESTGSSVAPCAARRRGSPRRPRPAASLLASTTVPPCSIAAITGASPAQPTIAAIVSRRRAARGFAHRLRAARRARCRCRQAPPAAPAGSFRRRPPPASAPRPQRRRGQAVDIAIGGQRDRPRNRSGSRSIRSSVEVPTEPVAPRMVTVFTRSRTVCGRMTTSNAATGATGTSPSSRSSTPPWPGSSVPLILHPGAALQPAFEQVAALRQRPRATGVAQHQPHDRASSQ